MLLRKPPLWDGDVIGVEGVGPLCRDGLVGVDDGAE